MKGINSSLDVSSHDERYPIGLSLEVGAVPQTLYWTGQCWEGGLSYIIFVWLWVVIEKHKKRITGLTKDPLTYSGLQEGGHKSPRGPLGAGQDGEGGDQQGQHRVTRHDDRVGRHTAGASEPGERWIEVSLEEMQSDATSWEHTNTQLTVGFQSVCFNFQMN